MAEEKNYTVYMHVNNINKKRYIGITSMNPEKRWGKNGAGYKTQVFGKAIEKYGWDNFEHEVIASGLNKEEAENFEILLIKKLKSNNDKFGYNISNGGNCVGYMSKSHREKLSKIAKKELELKIIFMENIIVKKLKK